LFLTGSSLTLVVATWILCVSLAHQANGLAEVAIFNAADRWRTAMLFLPSLLAQVSLPLFAHTLAQGNGQAYRRLLIGSSCTVLAVTAIPAGILILLGPWVMAGYGSAFVQGKPVLVLLAVTCLPMSLCMVGNYGLLAAGKTGTMLAIEVVRASIALSYCLTQTSFTAYDVAVATLFSYLVAAPLVGLALWRAAISGKMEAQFQGVLAAEGSS
jgi:O-antigen/teichoic acid export membrane protein